MEKQKKEQIIIPKGCFEGYCGGCFYAKREFVNSRQETLSTREGEIFCKKHEQIYPESDNGYSCYEGRIITWIKGILGIYFLIAAVVFVFSLLS